MIETLFSIVITWIQVLGWAGVFYASLLEEFIHVVPTSVVQLTAGAILLSGTPLSWALVGKSILIIGLPAAVGVTVGALPYFALGWFGGKPAVEKWGKWLGVSWKLVEDFDKKLSRTWWDELVFTGLRVLPFIPSIPISLGAGVVRLPLRTYLTGSFVGTFIRASVMGVIGATIGSRVSVLGKFMTHGEYAGLFIIVIVCVVGWWMITKKKK